MHTKLFQCEEKIVIFSILSGHPWIKDSNNAKVPLDILVFKLMRAYLRSSSLRKAALRVGGSVFPIFLFQWSLLFLLTVRHFLQALSKTLTVDELFYLREQFALLEPSKNGTISLENIKSVSFLSSVLFQYIFWYALVILTTLARLSLLGSDENGNRCNEGFAYSRILRTSKSLNSCNSMSKPHNLIW